MAGTELNCNRQLNMQKRIPNYNNKAIADFVMERYGIAGEISPLDSYEDQNARIKTLNCSYVLKIANNRLPIEDLRMQTDAIEYVRKTMPELNVPRLIPTKAGELITIIDGFAIRLLTFLEGNILGQGSYSPSLYNRIGHFMGQFSNAMQNFSHPDAYRPGDLWNLDNVLACREYLNDVKEADDRARIEHFYERYINDTQPRLPSLRRSVIHADANEQNLLVDAESPDDITGLIDFGDLQLATHVNEIAITMAYALLGEDDIEMAGKEILNGYTSEYPLDVEELEVLPNLIAMRLVQSILMSSHNAKRFPDNEYIPISQKPARALLKKLKNEPFII